MGCLTMNVNSWLGPQDIYLLDIASGGTFMSKQEDEAMELIETVVENSHHNAAKPFKRGAMAKGQMIEKNQRRRECSLKELTKWRKSKISYSTD